MVASKIFRYVWTITAAAVCVILIPGCVGTGATRDAATETRVYGRVYPERADDLAWENDLVGFRIYGPATQSKGEKAFGYDLFFKYADGDLVLESLYEPETNPRTWEIVDSLRAIDPAIADEYIETISYHIDHGKGMDCYPVGPTLGAGVCSLMAPDGEILFPWCYTDVHIVENGPDRFEAHLTFEPREINGMDSIVEHRIIRLDAGEHLNETRVWYDNLTESTGFIIGVPRRDDSPAVIDSVNGFIAYADPTDLRPGNTAILGLIYDSPVTRYCETNGHIGAVGTVSPGDTISYRWGFTWPKSDITDMDGWITYLKNKK